MATLSLDVQWRQKGNAKHKEERLTAEIRALGLESILGDLEVSLGANHRPVDVFRLNTPPFFDTEHPKLRLQTALWYKIRTGVRGSLTTKQNRGRSRVLSFSSRCIYPPVSRTIFLALFDLDGRNCLYKLDLRCDQATYRLYAATSRIIQLLHTRSHLFPYRSRNKLFYWFVHSPELRIGQWRIPRGICAGNSGLMGLVDHHQSTYYFLRRLPERGGAPVAAILAPDLLTIEDPTHKRTRGK